MFVCIPAKKMTMIQKSTCLRNIAAGSGREGLDTPTSEKPESDSPGAGLCFRGLFAGGFHPASGAFFPGNRQLWRTGFPFTGVCRVSAYFPSALALLSGVSCVPFLPECPFLDSGGGYRQGQSDRIRHIGSGVLSVFSVRPGAGGFDGVFLSQPAGTDFPAGGGLWELAVPSEKRL